MGFFRIIMSINYSWLYWNVGLMKSQVKYDWCIVNEFSGFSAGGLHIFRIIALSIVIPAMTCSICISCIICLRNRSVVAGRAHRNGGTGTGTAAVTPQPATIHAGLDDSTIESYTKVVLGESRRVPGPNHTACPICLADYHPKETVRCIPECEHCFHAECIDEWLRINGSCPVCRNSPSPSPDVHVVVNYWTK